jgi:siroheme synthase-like protein
MLVDLVVRGKAVVVVGGGEPARSRAKMLAKEGAKVTLLSEHGPRKGGPKRKNGGTPRPSETIELVRRVQPVLVLFTVPGEVPDPAVRRAARSVGALVHVYDAPALSDFTMPSIGTAGAIRVAVSTAGQSPAMAALLRRRIERGIRPADVAMVRLQGRLRATILRSLPTHEARKTMIYRILRHREVGKLLRSGRFEEAVALARTVIRSSASVDLAAVRKG